MSTDPGTTSGQHVKELRISMRRIANYSQNCFRKRIGSIALTAITDLRKWFAKIQVGCPLIISLISAVNMPVSDPKSDTTTGKGP